MLKPVRSYFQECSKNPLPQVGPEAIHETLNYLELPHDHFLIIGGAALVLRGIKPTTEDLDMLVSDDAFSSLSLRPGAEIKQPPTRARLQGADNTTVWVRNSSTAIPISATTALGDGYYPLSFNMHKHREEIVQGLPCLSLVEISASKTALQRPKDIDDLHAIASHLGEIVTTLPKPTIATPWLNS